MAHAQMASGWAGKITSNSGVKIATPPHTKLVVMRLMTPVMFRQRASIKRSVLYHARQAKTVGINATTTMRNRAIAIARVMLSFSLERGFRNYGTFRA